jgi:pimeloyl-ACP methyl ester carboxylesterase
MFIMAMMLIIGDGIVSQRGEITGYNGELAVWGATWILTLFVIVNITWFEHIQRLYDQKISIKNNPSSKITDQKLPPIFLGSTQEKLSQDENEQTVQSSKSSSCCCRKCCTLKCTIKGIGWSSIAFISVFGFLLAMNVAWSANDVLNYGPLGQRVTIRMNTQMNLSSVVSVISRSTINMHILCKGPSNSGSTFIFEAGSGAFSASFFALQDQLVAVGRRSCIYDRPGYGWSDVLPVLTNSYQSIFCLHELLKEIAEPTPYIMIGHSFGGQLIQLYAALFPSQVSGLILLDSIPDLIYPLSLTGNPMNTNLTFDDIKPYVTSAKSIIDLYRVGTPFGINRWLQTASADYQPSNLSGYYNAGYGKTLNCHAQYFDFIGTPHIIQILDNLSAQKYLNGFGWPTLRNNSTPVLGIITNSTAGGPGPLCASSIDNSCTVEARIGRAYYDGMQLQTNTLSNNATFITCDAPCYHSFVWTNKVNWIVETILAKFNGV